jgi:uncharacterized membrane-anchored protein YhcB (DUF1043 family)
MNNIADIISRGNSPVPEISFNLEGAEMERRSSSANYEIHGTRRGPTVDSPEAAIALSANLPKQPDQVDAEATELMNALDSAGMLVNPQYFAQTGNRRGFTYHYINAKQHNDSIKFESGVYVTNDPWLVRKLNEDISRVNGIGSYVNNISAATYNNIVIQARSYRAMASGMAGSNVGNAHKMAADQEREALKAMLEDQKRQIAELQNQLTGHTARTATAQPNAAKNFGRTDADRAVTAQRIEDTAQTGAMLSNLLAPDASVNVNVQ